VSRAPLTVALVGMFGTRQTPTPRTARCGQSPSFGWFAFLGSRSWFRGLLVHDTFLVRRGWLKNDRYELGPAPA